VYAPRWYAPRDVDDPFGAGVFDVGEKFETIIGEFYRRVLEPGGQAVDCGAHIGGHTFPLADCVSSSGIVYAIEPLKRLADRLNEECRRRSLDQVKVFQTAVSDKVGVSEFSDVQAAPWFSGLRLRDLPPGDMQIETSLVNTTTIDRIFEDFPPRAITPAFWKLDLEGGELHALKGARTSLQKFSPFLAFENGREYSAQLYGYSKDDWYSFFEELDYIVFDVFGNRFDDNLWAAPATPWYSIAAPASHPMAEQTADLLAEISATV
jgi:FkbM family methyltransferase